MRVLGVTRKGTEFLPCPLLFPRFFSASSIWASWIVKPRSLEAKFYGFYYRSRGGLSVTSPPMSPDARKTKSGEWTKRRGFQRKE